ncbi:MAG: hypothetical protein GW827_13095 [Flavobacteriales bacterium]|nr:hypothetical protein [Flavobacteriales bacterium]NCP91144.1 hypothetical protein [Flavobacteriales bacterium]NCQ15198.1 hypothetical protein [Flavobacteriales bacterium]NCQ58748.1 hypothetical protein [Flavobacteriales bacterium]NCT16101.1 hypothetical protein [Flavobacteriales bacterium]
MRYKNDKYIKLLKLELINFRPWKILPIEEGLDYAKDLKKRYPKRDLLPFSMRTDCDDVACWDSSKEEGKVFIIHDFASEGWEQQGEFKDFDEWFANALDDMFSFDD